MDDFKFNPIEGSIDNLIIAANDMQIGEHEIDPATGEADISGSTYDFSSDA